MAALKKKTTPAKVKPAAKSKKAPALDVEAAPGKRLLITDVVLRDGHQ